MMYLGLWFLFITDNRRGGSDDTLVTAGTGPAMPRTGSLLTITI